MSELTQQCLAEAERRVREHGFEPRKLQLAWRTDPPAYRDDGEWMRECTSAILDALTHEGVVAWDGDAVSCVVQIVQAYARQGWYADKVKEQATRIARLEADQERLWEILEQIDRIEPETTAWLEKQMRFQLSKRRLGAVVARS